MDNGFSALESKCRRDASWRGFPFALGRESTNVEMRQLRGRELSSVLRRPREGTTRFGAGFEPLQIRNVAMRRLDDPRVFFKLDTKGFDLEEFRGAESCFSRILGLQSELSLIPTYEGMPDNVEVLPTYRGQGFEETGCYPIFRFGRESVVGEFDRVMVRSGLGVA